MIGYLRGILLAKQPASLLLNVHGVGYEVGTSLNSYYQLPEMGQSVNLHVHLVIREDAHLLFGFVRLEERTLFRNLIRVNGVGPKLALTILSGIEANAFVRCIQLQDTTALVKLPGVGKKTAERLIIEMRDQLGDWNEVAESSLTGLPATAIGQPISVRAEDEAERALIALGYRPHQASKAVQAAVQQQPTASCEDLIRLALKGML